MYSYQNLLGNFWFLDDWAGDDWKSLPTLFDLPWNGNLNLIFTLRLIHLFFFLSRVIIIYRIFLRHMMFQNFCLHCLIIQWYLVKIIPFWGLLSFVFLEESYSCISALLERGWWWWIISLPTLPDQSYRLWATDWMINSSEAQSSNLALLFWFYYFEFDLRDFPHILLNIFPKRKVLLGLLMVDTYFSL